MRYRYTIENGVTKIKTNTKKYILSGAATVLLVVGLAVPAFAKPGGVPAAAPKATGSIGWSNSGAQAYDDFNAQMTSASCATAWNVNGTYTFDFEYLGGHYVHDAVISNQANGAYDINGGYPAGGSYQYAWGGTGTLSGNTVTNSVDYSLGAPNTHMDMTGTIASNGTMSGTWSDNYGGTRTGTWTTASGAATQTVTGCTGKGSFTYSDANGINYVMNVQYVNVSGNQAWFAGPTTSGNFGIGTWIFIKVADNGEPGIGHDQIWGQVVANETVAQNDVATMATPAGGPFTITSGNLQVH